MSRFKLVHLIFVDLLEISLQIYKMYVHSSLLIETCPRVNIWSDGPSINLLLWNIQSDMLPVKHHFLVSYQVIFSVFIISSLQ